LKVTSTFDPSCDTVGFVGLGDIGMPMMQGHLSAGHRVVAYDLRSEAVAQAVAAGARTCESLAMLAAECRIVCIAVLDSVQLASVVADLVPHLRADSLVVVHSTVRPEDVIAAGRQVTGAGARLLDAPVSGRRSGAVDRTLTVMVGGDHDLFEALLPMMSAYGVARHLGPLGSGQISKIANNMLCSSHMLIGHEVLRLVSAYGVDEERFRTLVSESSGASWALSHWDDVMRDMFLSHHLAGRPELIDFMGKEPWSAVISAHEAGVHSPILAMLGAAVWPVLTARMDLVLAEEHAEQARPTDA
jgi:3-hydroxyisobutyrate dehydrogenase